MLIELEQFSHLRQISARYNFLVPRSRRRLRRPSLRNVHMSRRRIHPAGIVAGIAATGIAVTGLLGLAAPAGAATSAGSAPAAPVTTGAATNVTAAACDRAPWQPVVQGAPAGFNAGDRGGDYLWHDLTGFHLRVTHRNDGRQVYSGLVSSSAPMRIDPVRLERGDVLRLSPDHRSFVFAFADYGWIDGVNFHTDCAAALAFSRLQVGRASAAGEPGVPGPPGGSPGRGAVRPASGLRLHGRPTSGEVRAGPGSRVPLCSRGLTVEHRQPMIS